MTAESYLKSIFLVQRYIDDKRAKYDDLMTQATGLKGIQYDKVKVQSGKKQDFTDFVDKAESVQAELFNDTIAYHMTVHKMANEIFEISKFDTLYSVYKKNLEKGFKQSKSKVYQEALAEFEEVHAQLLASGENLLNYFQAERRRIYKEMQTPLEEEAI
ncbi:MAG: hypothetical protein KBS60_00155 [Phascolarctobacterium sp.]|nr:hypothetical protein [Candidatus Phascolarctobacterium caballi]